MVKVNLTVRIPAEVRLFIEELSRRYGLGMGDLITFVFNEFRGEIIKRLESRRSGLQPQSLNPGNETGDILKRLVDEGAKPVSDEDYYLMLVSDTGLNSTVW
jgi:hypothetical protein